MDVVMTLIFTFNLVLFKPLARYSEGRVLKPESPSVRNFDRCRRQSSIVFTTS
jgi:hypothetical protein